MKKKGTKAKRWDRETLEYIMEQSWQANGEHGAGYYIDRETLDELVLQEDFIYFLKIPNYPTSSLKAIGVWKLMREVYFIGAKETLYGEQGSST